MAYKLKKPVVDVINKTIIIELGKPIISDNYITEKLVYDEQTTLLNRIESDQINRDDKKLMKEGEENAIENGLYEKAERHAKTIIKNEFDGLNYKIIFKKGGK